MFNYLYWVSGVPDIGWVVPEGGELVGGAAEGLQARHLGQELLLPAGEHQLHLQHLRQVDEQGGEGGGEQVAGEGVGGGAGAGAGEEGVGVAHRAVPAKYILQLFW